MKRLLALLVITAASAVDAQAPRGWETSALPALNFNSDEGFGYGLTAQGYHYGDGTLKPYKYTIQPLLFLTTRGRRDVSVFFDAPHLLPGGWRVSSYVGWEQQQATPYYGVGNSTAYDKNMEEDPNPYYYRYGRKRFRANADFQRSLGGPLRFLVGGSTRNTEIDKTPFDSGATLVTAQTVGQTFLTSSSVLGRIGLVYDTRDRETGPTRGQWVEGLAQRSIDNGYTRLTGTARAYVPLHDRLTWAQRVVAQNLSGNVGFEELSTIQGSFKDDEGLGGSSTVRGLPKNRFIGKGILFVNEELRWRAAAFRVRGRESALILSTFVDAGRVWERGLSTDGLFSDYHVGYGGGVRVRYGPNFVVAVDVGHSRESTAPIYIGLGYLF